MNLNKIISFLAIAVICSVLLTSGCEPAAKEPAEVIKVEPEKIVEKPAEKQVAKPVERPVAKPVEKTVEKAAAIKTVKGPVSLALKFKLNDFTTYKIVIKTEDSVKLKAPEPSRNVGNLEMTFTQRIKSIKDNGNAIAQIIIKEVKYLDMKMNVPIVNYDSTSGQDRHNPMRRLIGEGYRIEITPQGQIEEVTGFMKAQLAIKSGAKPGMAAKALVQPAAVKARHGLVALPDSGKSEINVTDNWSRLKVWDFRILGSKSYEKIYTLKEVQDLGDRQIAIVEMEAIPTAEMARQQHKEETDPFSKMADSTDSYTGQLKLDLTAGKVEKFVEQYESKWVIVDPSSKGRKNPATVIMKATRFYSLEIVD